MKFTDEQKELYLRLCGWENFESKSSIWTKSSIWVKMNDLSVTNIYGGKWFTLDSAFNFQKGFKNANN